MSGGHFDYQEYHFSNIAQEIAGFILHNNEKEVTPEGITIGYEFSEETIAKFREAYYIIRKAYIYAKEIDYLVSSDSGEESFAEYLEKELKKIDELKKESKIEDWW